MTRNVSLRHLRCFIAVAEEGSFTSAAQRLFLTQSTLTATIRQFEEAIGVKMFDRTTRKVEMTQEALRFKSEAERLVAQFDCSISDLQAFSEGQKGHLKIGAAASVIDHFLANTIKEFRKSHPDITFSLRDVSAKLAEDLIMSGDIDFAITSRHKGINELCYAPLLEDAYGAICSKEHAFGSNDRPLNWSDLTPDGYLSLTWDTGIGAHLRNNLVDPNFFAKQGDEMSSTTSLHTMLASGPYYSVVPALVKSKTEYENFVFRRLVPNLTREICLITRPIRSISPSAKQFLDILRDVLCKNPMPDGVKPLS